MAKPTPLQRYHLILLWFFRVFTAACAIGALAVTAIATPALARDRNAKEVVVTVVLAAVIIVVGIMLSIFVGKILRRYNAHIAALAD